MIPAAIVLFAFAFRLSSSLQYCDPSLKCWPLDHEIQSLILSLDPAADRSGLFRSNPVKGGSPYSSAIPIYSASDQPLYGFETPLKSLYVNNSTLSSSCFSTSTEDREICFAATRNNPLSFSPAFVAFPTSPSHVQTLVRFAKDHDLCVSVLGTGHDFLDRHSGICEFSLLIRTSLLKSIEQDSATGTVKLGSGLTFSEVQEEISPLFIASGWSITVGILGWSIGGGHGPMSPKFGLGVDNIVSFNIVTADANLITCNSTNNYDLFRAVRGGGGSTWGVIVSITLKTHSLPEGGANLFRFYIASGDYCDKETLEKSVDDFIDVISDLDENWAGLTFIEPAASNKKRKCGMELTMFSQYLFQGSENDGAEFVKRMENLGLPLLSSTPITNWNDEYVKTTDPEYIIPVPWTFPVANVAVGGVPSVLVNSEKASVLSEVIKDRFSSCAGESQICDRIEIYHDITGNSQAGAFPSDDVSITIEFRTALFHVVSNAKPDEIDEVFYGRLGDYSYQNECAYDISEASGGWKKRVFGEQYEFLLSVKEKFDPDNIFWCHHCIGDETADSTRGTTAGATTGATVGTAALAATLAAGIAK